MDAARPAPRRVRCACGDPACRELVDPRCGRLYADGHRQKAYKRRMSGRLPGPFWRGYRALQRPHPARRQALRESPAAP